MWKGEKMKRKIIVTILAIVLVLSVTLCLISCDNDKDNEPTTIRISTTTSVNDSGLMNYLTPYFEADNPDYKLEISSAGTGAAINAAKFGNADLILVHSKSQEDAFVTADFSRKVSGFDAERISFMYNFFTIVGPSQDPANVEGAQNAEDAFSSIANGQHKFVSRGDKSGTHTAEIKLWDTLLGITNDVTKLPESINSWYISAGQGMGACLTMANEQGAYVLCDKATYLSYKNDKSGDKLPNLTLLMEDSPNLKNTYSMLAVSQDAPFVDSVTNEKLPAGTIKVNEQAADIFIKWMNSEHASALINFYGTTQYGAPLFYLL
jgi:tungstate transport system substrate-binding protein